MMFTSFTRMFARLIFPAASAGKTMLAAGLLVTTLAATSRAELIPANRLIDWSPGVNVGVPGGIDQYLSGGARQRTTLVDVTKSPYNADRTGATDAAKAIQSAIDAAPAGSVVYLPAGKYRCDSTLSISFNKDGITLRGDGASTIIDSRAGTGISVGCASDYSWSWPTTGNVVTAGLTKGSSTITIGDTSEFTVGRLLRFSFQNDSKIPVVHVSGYDYVRHQMSIVTARTSNTVTFSPALYEDYSSSTKVNVAQLQTDYVGVEDLTIDFSNGTATFGVQFEQCYGCWVKNVRVTKSSNYAFFLYDSARCEIRKSFADQRKSEGTNGGGVLCNTSSACLVEDNILYKFFPLIEINQGSSGNVFAYNFCYDSDVYGGMGAGIDSNHGPHNSYNLFEGNLAPNIQCDGYFGGASRDTVFRNWFHATSPAISSGWAISLNRFTRDYSLVGNVFGSSSANAAYSFGNPNMGNSSSTGTAQPSKGIWWADWGKTPGPAGFQEKDLDVEASSVRKGNYVFGTGIPSDEGLGSDVIPSSLYRSSKPSWFGSLAWPAVNPTNTGNLSHEMIPAGYRWVHGTDAPGIGTQQAPSNVRVQIQTQ